MATDDGTAARILVIAPSWVGDLVMAEPLVAGLSLRHPGSTIDAVAPPATFPLLERIPGIDKGILLPVAHGELGLGKRLSVAKAISREGYDQAVVLPNSFKSALLPWFARVPIRTGWKGEMRYGLVNDLRTLNPTELPLMVDRFRALAEPPGRGFSGGKQHPLLKVDPANLNQVRARLGLSDVRPVLGLCPGAEYGEAKQWPARHYAVVASKAIESGWQVWVLGGPGDSGISSELARLVDPALSHECFNLAGKTSLPEVVDLISATSAVVSNDSGLMHIAAALDRPMWVIYGSSSPGFTPPLSDFAQVISLDLECSPCFKRVCPLGHRNCLEELSPGHLLDKMQGTIYSSNPGHPSSPPDPDVP